MAIYERFNARIANTVRLRRDFYDNGVLFDPYKIDKIEIWKTRFDLEFEAQNPGSLLVDTIYGSNIILNGITNNAYGTLGLESGSVSPALVSLVNYEQAFTGETALTVTHNLNDRFPIVTIYNTLGTVIIPNEITSLSVNAVLINFATPQSGTVDIVGATAVTTSTPVSLVKQYIQSFTNQQIVTIIHNLNDDFPNLSIYDSNFNMLFPSTIQSVDSNTIILSFTSPETGTVIVTGGNVGFATSGFGASAEIVGTNISPFGINSGRNDRILISVDGGADQNISLSSNCASTALDIVAELNTLLTGITASVYNNNQIKIVSNTVGTTSSLELKAVVNAAYPTLGFSVGLVNGFGYPPASTSGTRTGAFTITPTTNWVKVAIDGGLAVSIDLLEGDSITKRITAARVAQIIANGLTAGNATVDSNRRVQISGTSSVEIETITNDAYTELGFTVGLYGATVTGSDSEYYIITSLNNRLSITIDKNDPVEVDLTLGNLTIFQIVQQINTVFTTNNIDAVASVTTGTTGGRLKIDNLDNDGISRTGLGQYYIDWDVPTSFLIDGVLLKQGLDVWYYAPTSTYGNDIPDDTDTFIVYADSFFLDSGFNNYDFAFTLMRDLFYKGELRPLITKVVALPRYKTPVVNDWILPLSNAQYRILTDESSLIQDWTDTDLNSGTEIRVYLDTTNPVYREGLYNLQLRVNIPNGDVLMSSRLKFRITNK